MHREEVEQSDGYARWRFTVNRDVDGPAVLEFVAFDAVLAGGGEIAVAATPQDGRVNMFVVFESDAHAEYVGTTRYTPPNWSFSAHSPYVMWVDNACGEQPGNIFIRNRASGVLTEIVVPEDDPHGYSLRWVAFTPDGLIAVGAFGADALIDPKTLEYVAVLPGGGDTIWSADYRYASRGLTFGHGGLCVG